MVKIIVFEKNGEIRLATLIDDDKSVCRENFTDVVPCPEELLACVPSEIAEFCKETAPQYLYFNSESKWESTNGGVTIYCYKFYMLFLLKVLIIKENYVKVKTMN